ncbi:MAG: hypothetical protein HY697_04860 [Deltaproteobacteria bacterium]|nr:hypothetical protein [Deltaproteobacteria bacterium]
MEESTKEEIVHESTVRTWFIVLGLALGFLVWGFVVFYTVGDKGSPGWDFSIIEDIPGQSFYSTAGPRQFPGRAGRPITGGPVIEQHVREKSQAPGEGIPR